MGTLGRATGSVPYVASWPGRDLTIIKFYTVDEKQPPRLNKLPPKVSFFSYLNKFQPSEIPSAFFMSFLNKSVTGLYFTCYCLNNLNG